MAMDAEIRNELTKKLIPFWRGLRDDEYGGWYGYRSFDLVTDKKAVKGCILMSRITWFFSNAYILLRDPLLLEDARHGFAFLKDHCFDREAGGVFWMIRYDGTPEDTMKHTYCQAFAIYALSSYADASGDPEALALARNLCHIIETKMRDADGYLEAFDRNFGPVKNDALSENGVMASRTMNTLLHVLEAYTELYRVGRDEDVKSSIEEILKIFAEKVWNPQKERQEVFFDLEYRSLIDLWSYGHDIESAWLINRATDILDEPEYKSLMDPITADMVKQVYEKAFNGHSIPLECENGVRNETRVWWVQCEAINGFIDAYERDPSKKEYLSAAERIWDYTKATLIDPREGSEWYWAVSKDGVPDGEPIVEPWKCPYHNGRMCFEVLRRWPRIC